MVSLYDRYCMIKIDTRDHAGAAMFMRSTPGSSGWMWNFGRPQPQVGSLSVAKTEQIRNKSRSEAAQRAWKTKNARKRPAEEEESS